VGLPQNKNQKYLGKGGKEGRKKISGKREFEEEVGGTKLRKDGGGGYRGENKSPSYAGGERRTKNSKRKRMNKNSCTSD